MEADNDIASDTDEVEARVRSGVNSLMEAIRDQHH